MSASESFIQAYIEAMLWANTIDTTLPDDASDYTIDARDKQNALTLEALQRMREDCESFVNTHGDLLTETPDWYNDTTAGHDFALSRCGHGAGFFDRGNRSSGNYRTRRGCSVKPH